MAYANAKSVPIHLFPPLHRSHYRSSEEQYEEDAVWAQHTLGMHPRPAAVGLHFQVWSLVVFERCRPKRLLLLLGGCSEDGWRNRRSDSDQEGQQGFGDGHCWCRCKQGTLYG